MSTPRATMRLQFHRGFTFADAAGLTRYFSALGISHLYASPVMTARHGSLHGYDVVDPTRVNPELGGEEKLRALTLALRRHGMGLIVDIVPNHMAVGSDNPWWVDVLARGRESQYAKYFDIDWNPPQPHLRDKVLLPILARPYGEALAAGDIVLDRGGPTTHPVIRYFDHVLPIAERTLGGIQVAAAESFDARTAVGRECLHSLLESQHYRLAWWRSANDEINWRRFFDINDLAALRMEDNEVFEAVHAALFRLYAEGVIDGVRVDHIDGLANPEAYCRTLRMRLGELERSRPNGSPRGRAFLVIEKILGRGESLPQQWECDGTTGYDFMDEVSALLHDASGEATLRSSWHRLSGRSGDFAVEEELARRQILQRSFSAQRDALVENLYGIAQSDLDTRDFSRVAVGRGLTELLAHFPVYRTYIRLERAAPADLAFMSQAADAAKLTCVPGDRAVIDVIARWLSGMRIRPEVDRAQKIALVRFQQLTTSLAAKAVEDTAFYRYGRLLSRNDVGFDVRCFATTPAQFHERMQARAAAFPHSMLATATHDHKRGEDVRARLAVLSELAEEWTQAVERWIAMGTDFRTKADGVLIPSNADLAILFQTVVGSWPYALALDDRSGLAEFGNRVAAWQQKALREAKLESDWACPNEPYEEAARGYIARLFGEPSMLLAEIAGFARRIAIAGAAYALGQLVAKITAPGVPDIYQGTEYWDFSLVDPDNRRDVDYLTRQRSLDSDPAAALPNDWTEARFKQALIARLLNLRRMMPRVFADGGYTPISVEGPLAEHVVAFARTFERSAVVTVFCRLTADFFVDAGPRQIEPDRWNGTSITLPAEVETAALSNALITAGESIRDRRIGVGRILAPFPIAIFAAH